MRRLRRASRETWQPPVAPPGAFAEAATSPPVAVAAPFAGFLPPFVLCQSYPCACQSPPCACDYATCSSQCCGCCQKP